MGWWGEEGGSSDSEESESPPSTGRAGKGRAGRITRPLRHNGIPYKGINVVMLWSASVVKGYACPLWLTFKQAHDLGGKVKKGEKATPVIYYKLFEKRDDHGNLVLGSNGRPTRIPFIRWSNAFNLDQTEGIEPPSLKTGF